LTDGGVGVVVCPGARQEYHVWGEGLSPRHGERDSITGVWGGAKPLVRGAKARSPPEAENLLASGCTTKAANLPHSVRTLTLSK